MHRPRRVFPLACLLLPLVLGQSACGTGDGDRASSDLHAYRAEVLFEGLEHPWALAFLPDGRMLVTERSGRLNLLDPRDSSWQQIAGVPEVAAVGQGGLLDVALHPGFEDNGWVYLSYAAWHEGGLATHVGRGRLAGDHLEDFQLLFRAEPALGSGQHFGSRLVFDGDGHLFVTVGDHGVRDSAQDLGTHMGTVIRLTDAGQVPGDNPFAGEAGARPEIYSYGHRNPQGMTLHPQTGVLWLHEHGPRGGDELNLPRPGLNYGWPEVTFGSEYSGPPIGLEPPQPGFEPPIHHWTPAIAPSGMAFYEGDQFPAWRGDLFVGALVQRRLLRLRLVGGQVIEQEPLLSDLQWRIRDVRSGPDGYLYVLPDEPVAALIRLVPAD